MQCDILHSHIEVADLNSSPADLIYMCFHDSWVHDIAVRNFCIFFFWYFFSPAAILSCYCYYYCIITIMYLLINNIRGPSIWLLVRHPLLGYLLSLWRHICVTGSVLYTLCPTQSEPVFTRTFIMGTNILWSAEHVCTAWMCSQQSSYSTSGT